MVEVVATTPQLLKALGINPDLNWTSFNFDFYCFF